MDKKAGLRGRKRDPAYDIHPFGEEDEEGSDGGKGGHFHFLV